MELWIPITVAAAFLQNLRSMLQKRATGDLSVNGASYTRFLFALPFVWACLFWLGTQAALPEPSLEFLAFCLVGGAAQILGTAFLLASFTHDNFAVGVWEHLIEFVKFCPFCRVKIAKFLARNLADQLAAL